MSDMKILIAEDEPDSRQLLQIIVSRWGYEAVATRDGLEAWEALQQADAPQLALLDIMMPRMDGLEVCRRIRERGAPVPTYIIILTAKALPSEIVTGLEAGADDYLT